MVMALWLALYMTPAARMRFATGPSLFLRVVGLFAGVQGWLNSWRAGRRPHFKPRIQDPEHMAPSSDGTESSLIRDGDKVNVQSPH